MAKAETYSAAGAKQATPINLDHEVFDQPVNANLVKLAYNAYLANRRTAGATTKTRGLVRGGGKKPWRQKGTGRARVGSIRVPQWRGGGVVFGPTGQENYRAQLPQQLKRQAIRQALSAQAADGNVLIVETFNADGKVKPTLELLGKLGVRGSVLLVVSQKDDLVDRATRNLAGVKAVQANYLNVYDIMNADKLIIVKNAVGMISDWLRPVDLSQKPVKTKAGS